MKKVKIIKFYKVFSIKEYFMHLFYNHHVMNGLIIKRKIISSSFFWKTRNYIHHKWIEAYDLKPVPKSLLDFALSKKITSALDFGCASGNFLYELKKKNIKTCCYGIDINKNALNTCNKKFNKLDSLKKPISSIRIRTIKS